MTTEFIWMAIERAGPLIVIAWLGTALTHLLTASRGLTAAAGIAFVALALLPVGDASGLTYLYSAIGPLSIAAILACSLYSAAYLRLLPGFEGRELRLWAGVIAVLGLVLYPGAIGLLPWDPYRLGYFGPVLPAVLIGIAGAGAALGSAILPLWIALSAAAWHLGLFGSANLWDYVIDPLAWLASWGVLFKVALDKRRRRLAA